VELEMARTIQLVAGLALAAVSLSAAATDSDCLLVGQSFKKSFGMPYHGYITKTEGGKLKQSEMIYDGHNLFIQFRGQWKEMGDFPNPFEDVMKDMGEHKGSCTKTRSESKDGQSATVYELKYEVEGSPTDGLVWIGSNGLVVHIQSKSDELFEERLDYAHVNAPANAKKLGQP
jgi:hypothetical protein